MAKATHTGLATTALAEAQKAVVAGDWKAAHEAISVALLTAEAALRAEGKL